MRHKDMMRQLKHYLECKNVANMMYILCMERRKCQAERENTEHCSRKKVAFLKVFFVRFIIILINYNAGVTFG